MAHYKGKREATPSEEKPFRREPGQNTEDPFAAGGRGQSPVIDDPFLEESGGDPFAEESTGGLRGKLAAAGAACARFFASRKGKITVIVVCCVLAFAVGGIIAVRTHVKPPEILPPDGQSGQSGQQGQADGVQGKPAEPTDDELYPDDGYGGDMPEAGGDRKSGVYTFLLMGTDKDDGNTDTIMLVSYDTANQDISIMSIPRDTMTNEWWDIKKINSIYSRTGNSIDSVKKRIKSLVGFTPDFYVKVELEMFVELVDLVGGVEFDVPQDMDYEDPYQDLYIHLKKGVQVLDGEKAMQLVRFRRYTEGDIKRVEVQQSFMKALIKECLSLKHWGKIKAYIDLAMDHVETDLEFGSVVWFAANVMGLNSGVSMLRMEDVYTCTLPGNYWGEAWSRDSGQYQSYVTIYPNQVVELMNERFNPYLQNVTTGMLDAMSILENGDIAASSGSLKDTKHNAVMAVRRGEAYYDESGSLVYGKPPVKPEQDEFGNYYILDESGNRVYTDANGTPLTDLPQAPGTGNETNQPGQGQTTPGGETVPPTEPTLPPEEPAGAGESSGDAGNAENTGEAGESEIPGWLRH